MNAREIGVADVGRSGSLGADVSAPSAPSSSLRSARAEDTW